MTNVSKHVRAAAAATLLATVGMMSPAIAADDKKGESWLCSTVGLFCADESASKADPAEAAPAGSTTDAASGAAKDATSDATTSAPAAAATDAASGAASDATTAVKEAVMPVVPPATTP